jgi:hypothetical protein
MPDADAHAQALSEAETAEIRRPDAPDEAPEDVLDAAAQQVGRQYVLAADSLSDVADWLAAQVSDRRENEVAHRLTNCARVLRGRGL